MAIALKECIWTEDDTGHPKGVAPSKQQNLAGNGVNSCGRRWKTKQSCSAGIVEDKPVWEAMKYW